MIEPYQAIGLVPTMRGIRHRDEIGVNIEHIRHLIKAASWLSSLDLPVRLIAIPEGALQGFNDEVLDLDHETFARECAIDVPGPETDALGELARQWNAFVMGQAKARHPEFPGRFFNVGFVLDPAGEIVLRHHKVVPLLPVEHSVTPHNVWDKWIELYGRNLDAFYPVADTEIGRLGFLMANEGSYPENARGLAMNGAEVVYRRPGAGQQLLPDRLQCRHLLPAHRLGRADRHVRRRLGGDRLPGPDRRAARLQRGLVLGGRDHRCGGAAQVPGRRAVGQLDQGPDHRAVPAHLRRADLPEEPLPGPRPVHACGVPARGHRPADRADARARRLAAPGQGLRYSRRSHAAVSARRVLRLLADEAHDVLDAGVVLEAVHGQVLAVTGVLEAAVRHLGHD